jgi:hypothetical protein
MFTYLTAVVDGAGMRYLIEVQQLAPNAKRPKMVLLHNKVRQRKHNIRLVTLSVE